MTTAMNEKQRAAIQAVEEVLTCWPIYGPAETSENGLAGKLWDPSIFWSNHYLRICTQGARREPPAATPRVRSRQLSPNSLGGDKSTPHFHFEARHAREMPDVVRDQSHPLGYRV